MELKKAIFCALCDTMEKYTTLDLVNAYEFRDQGRIKEFVSNKVEHAVPNRKPYYVCFEGVDGAGKSTQIRLVGKHLEKCGYKVLLTKEPGTPLIPLTMKLREIMLDAQYDHEMTTLSREYISQAIRSIHLEKLVKPIMVKTDDTTENLQYDFILQDRGLLSGVAYGIVCGNDKDFIYEMMRRTRGSTPAYDQVIIIDGDIEKCLVRASKSKQEFKGGDVIEAKGLEFMKHVHTLLLANVDLVTKSHHIVYGAHEKSIEDVTNQILKNIAGLRK